MERRLSMGQRSPFDIDCNSRVHLDDETQPDSRVNDPSRHNFLGTLLLSPDLETAFDRYHESDN